MNLKNRRISCKISKRIQEEQFEPFEIELSLDGDVPDTVDINEEYEEIIEYLESKVIEKINAHFT